MQLLLTTVVALSLTHVVTSHVLVVHLPEETRSSNSTVMFEVDVQALAEHW